MNKSKQPGSPAEKREKSAVPAVEKAFDVLELLADVPDGLTINQIAATLERTIGEIYRIIIYLAERGYLMQNPQSNRYTLTFRLFEIAYQHDPTQKLIRQALPVMERIAANTDQSCHISVLNRGNILVLASVPSPHPAGYSVRNGALFPVKDTSAGHVILAFSDNAAQERYLMRLAKKSAARIQERLEKIRARGFEDTASTMVSGIRNLCAPVFDARGIAAAITCGFIVRTEQKTTPDYALSVVRHAALQLSQSLGFRLAGSPLEVSFASQPHPPAEHDE